VDTSRHLRRGLSPGSVFIPLDILNSWRDEVLSVVSRVKESDRGFVVMEVNDNPNLDHGVEDQVGKDEIWTRLMIAGLGHSLERTASELLGYHPSKLDRTRIGDRLRNGLDELANKVARLRDSI
jgi:hypothetical protein